MSSFKKIIIALLYLAFSFTSTQAMEPIGASVSDSSSLKRKTPEAKSKEQEGKRISLAVQTPSFLAPIELNSEASVSQGKTQAAGTSQPEATVSSPDPLRPSIQSLPSNSSSTPPLTVPKTTPKNYLQQLNGILALEPNPLPLITQPISAEVEDKEGSRKWVPSFKDPEVHQWHTKMAALVSNVQRMTIGTSLSGKNFVIARLCFPLENGKRKEKPLPFIFISGWPNKKDAESGVELSKLLESGKLGGEFKDYEVRFLTKGFKNGKQTYNKVRYKHKDILNVVYEKETKNQDPIPSLKRLSIHKKVMGSEDSVTDGFFQYHYFHSEQALRLVVKEEIEKFKKSRTGPITKWFLKPQEEKTDFIVDICSYYDVCWCCADTLASTCHTLELGFPVYVRATGLNLYSDSPFSKIEPVALRHQRKNFPSYQQGKEGFERQQGDDISTYRPYIAHSMKEDWK
jgi:hypothetical protein